MDSSDSELIPRKKGMPLMGLGTWKLSGNSGIDAIKFALEVGYRHIDTAQLYLNEIEVGKGVSSAEIDRDELFIATKIHTNDLSYKDVMSAAESSVDRLKTEYIDILYVHWPAGTYDPEETLSAFSDLRDDGVISHIGVSNFEPLQLDLAQKECDSPIFANQIEFHPLLQQSTLLNYCNSEDILVVAYSPMARGEIFGVNELENIASKYNLTEAEISLSWIKSKNATPIPKASSKDHIQSNIENFNLCLSDHDISTIDSISTEIRQVNPDFAPWNLNI
jgi:2,5-diketo-D-gluconate reductase B